jgi:hypothetical protein
MRQRRRYGVDPKMEVYNGLMRRMPSDRGKPD